MECQPQEIAVLNMRAQGLGIAVQREAAGSGKI